MTELLTAAQMRAIEQAAIESGVVTGLELMERAGQGVVEAIFEEWPEFAKTSHRAVVLCGPGNNGGDGFVVARLLQEFGWTVEVFLYGDTEKLPADARVNHDRWLEIGPVRSLTERSFRASDGRMAGAIVVDALFGIGLNRPLSGELLNLVRHLSGVNGDHYRDHLVSIDVPSGLCADSGIFLKPELPSGLKAMQQHTRILPARSKMPLEWLASLTVTFDLPKVGHFLENGPQLCGKIVVKDIGLEPWRVVEPGSGQKRTGQARVPKQRLVTQQPIVPDPRSFLDFNGFARLNKLGHHKFSSGHALVLSGPATQTGAARLAARGTLRVGSGLVTIGAPSDALPECAAQLTSIMLKSCDSGGDFAVLLKDQRINALCLGPGLGLDRAQDLVAAALNARGRRPTVLDADALTAFQDDPQVVFDQIHAGCVLTPHGGEFRRLFPDIHERLITPAKAGPAYSKVAATRDAAARAGCVILFKGADTVIASPDGQCSIHAAHYERVAPWLATAGAGDVLAGFVTGLLARGLPPMQAAETAAWLHVECARSFGPGLIAEDLPEELPKVLRQLLAD
ncbi:MAG: NAD(P)H-hydrate dehydratase [Pseudomonadota bacterium]